ncbi:MAG: xylulose kinase [Bifidobacteriaceae bacterium]|jgi:xylulokinase|nr:xylulose kinase [Bifidobacteriaceae bacterium]
MTLVAGVDTSTQSCKVVVRDAETGALVRSGRAAHPDGTEVHPDAWWDAYQEASRAAGGIEDVAAVAVGGQQHGMVVLDAEGAVVRPALLWNDTRSAAAAEDLIAELGGGSREAGAKAWAQAIGSVPVASLTVTKLRWLAANEPANAARVAAVALPHDWLSWRLAGNGRLSDAVPPPSSARPGLARGAAAARLDALFTDRSDASGTGYWSPFTEDYRFDLLERAFGGRPLLPRVAGPADVGGQTPQGALIGPGAGDNAAAALGLELEAGDVAISLGTSGVVSAISETPTADPTGTVTGFADANGAYLPLACTLNGSRVLDAARSFLGVDYAELDRLALAAPPGADGLVMVPYLEGERTPNKPRSTGALHGLRLANSTPAHLARAAVEGLACLLADGLDGIVSLGIPVRRVLLIGGGAQSRAFREILPTVFGMPVVVPPPGEYVADGAARQAARLALGALPHWERPGTEVFEAPAAPQVREQYAEVRDLTHNR